MRKKTKNESAPLLKVFLIIIATIVCQSIFAQSQLVKGVITSNDGEKMIGVAVAIKGTTTGTVTNAEGEFSLQVPNSSATLKVSLIGYKSQEISIQGKTTISVVLVPDLKSLDAVIVTGYSTQKKADLTGAVSVVDVEELKKSSANNPMQVLQGRVPGVSISTDGSPSGSNTSIRIRGIGTLNNNDPLYIIDGVPTKGGMHELNSTDIENIQILRDASAASIYGSRAANGVIIITTKKGKSGKTKVNFDTYLSTSNYGNVVDMLNTKQFGEAQWQAMVNSGMNPNTNQIGYVYDYSYDSNGNSVLNGMMVPKFIDSRDGANTMLSSNTDWFKEITRPGVVQSYNLSVSNGSDKSTSFFSLGYYDNQGTIKESNFNRISGRLNTTYKLLDDFMTIGENFTLNHNQELQAPGGVLDLALMALPILPVYRENGDWAAVTNGMLDRDNPARILNANKDNPYTYWRTFGNVFIDIQPIKNLHVKSSYGLDYGNYYQRVLTYSYSGRLGSDLTSSRIIQSHSTKWVWSNLATYEFKMDKNQFNFLVGAELNSETNINFSTERRTYELESPEYMWPSAGVGEMFSTGGATGYKLSSQFGKFDYSFNDKYLASFTLRRDGSSRFGKENRFGTFPAFSAGWRISQENFMDGIKSIVSDLKLRAGWGQTGNQEIDNYANQTLIIANYIGSTGAGINSGTAYDISGAGSGMLPSGYQLTQRSNDRIKWETTTQTNIGLDFGLFNQNIFGSLEWYKKQTDDILVKPPYLGAIGEGGDHWVNGASMENNGVELSLGFRGKSSSGFGYEIMGNMSTNSNKITMLPESVVNNYGGNGTTDNILGKPINSFYGYVADGLFRTQDEVNNSAEQTGKGLGRIRYKDLNGDGYVNEQDRSWIGNPNPSLEFGLNVVLDYKGFDFTAFIQGVTGNKVVNNVKRFTDFWSVDQLGANKGTRLLGAWSPTNPNSDIPALSYSDLNNEKRFSSYYVESGSYVKLRNIQLGYTLPSTLTKSAKVDKLRLYVSGQNLLTIKSSDFTGLDPENPNLAYPISSILTVGVNIGF